MRLLAQEHRGVVAIIVSATSVVLAVWWVLGVVYAWLLVSAIGTVVSAYLTNESRHDLRSLPNRTNGRRLAAWSRLLREFLRVTVHLAYIVAGLIALGVLPLPQGVLVPILMYGNIALVVNSLIDARTRYLLFASRDAEPTIPH